jgi:CBS domain-containing protein
LTLATIFIAGNFESFSARCRAPSKEDPIMYVQDLMTHNPTCCSPEMSLTEIARSMVEHDCGEIPVLEHGQPIGVVTDRDIACRSLGFGKNPLEMSARDIMSSPVITVPQDAEIAEACRIMAQAQVRRIPVVDSQGRCCGIISAADIARRAPEHDTAQVIREVSLATGTSSRVDQLLH